MATSPAPPPERPTDAELLRAVGHALIATDLDGTIVFWNPAAERIYGWRAEEVLGRDVTEVTVPQGSQKAAAGIMEALRDGRAWSGGFSVQRRDGTTMHALVTDCGIRRDGALVGILGASLDLGDAARHLMERSIDAVVLLDLDGCVEHVSPAVTRLFGWTVEEVVGMPLSDLIHPEDLGTWQELLDPDSPVHGEEGEVRVRADGDWTWVEAAVTDLYAESEKASTLCHLRHSERLTRIQERERLLEAMHADVLQDLFAASLAVDHLRTRAAESARPRLELARDAIGRAIETLREAVRPEP